MKVIILLSILCLVFSCSRSVLVDANKVDAIEKDCNKLRIKRFKKLNDCEKIAYLYRIRSQRVRVSNETFINILSVMSEETNIYHSLVFNFAGGVYPSDTLFDYDIKRWSNTMGCDSIVQYKRIY